MTATTLTPLDTLGSLLHAPPATTTTTATLREAAADLAGEHRGVLLVMGPRGLAGVVSERDVVRAIGEGEDPDQLRVEEVSTEDVVTLTPHNTIADAMVLMNANEIRHVVVMDGRKAVGVVSSRDILRAIVGPRVTEA